MCQTGKEPAEVPRSKLKAPKKDQPPRTALHKPSPTDSERPLMKKQSVVGLNLWENHRFMVPMRDLEIVEAVHEPPEVSHGFKAFRNSQKQIRESL
jgi:hypothetical protein